MKHKYLTLVRHAEATSANADIMDFDRTLSTTGKAQALFIGGHLKSRGTHFGKMYSSPALRALATAQLLAQMLNYPIENIITEIAIYNQHTEQIISFIISFPDEHNHIALVGHNPTISELVTLMSGANLGNIPTCGSIQIEFLTPRWSEIWRSPGRLLNFDYPKS